MKPVLLKEELVHVPASLLKNQNHGARGKHTFDDDDDDDLDLDGEDDEADDNSSKPREELGSQLSKYYMGFEGNQTDEGQEEQPFYDLYYNYEGSGSQGGIKHSENLKAHRADAYPKSLYNDVGRHYADKKIEDAEHERAYISKNHKSNTSDQPNSHGRNKDIKSNVNSQAQMNFQNNNKTSKQQPKTYQTNRKEEIAEPNNRQQRRPQNKPYEDDEDNYHQDNAQSRSNINQKNKSQQPNSPQPQEDNKAVKKLRTKQIYYVSKGETIQNPNEISSPYTYPSKTQETDYDYQGSYEGYNYDYGYTYPEPEPESSHQIYPQHAYNQLHEPKPAVPKQAAYPSKEVPLQVPIPKDARHPGYPMAGPQMPAYDSNHLGSYNYNQPTRPFEDVQMPYKPYYGEQAAYGEPAQYAYGGEESYNFEPPQRRAEPAGPAPAWTYGPGAEGNGAPMLHKYYSQQRQMPAPVQSPPPPQQPHLAYNYQAAKVPKPLRPGKN